MASEMHRWVCEDPSCNHTLYATQQPDPSRSKYKFKNHICSFIPVPHIEEQPTYEMDGRKVEGTMLGCGLKEIIHANYICGGFLDYTRLRAVVMLNPGEVVTFQSGDSTCDIRRLT